MTDLYEYEDTRLFVNGEYRATLESKTDDDGICQHVTALCNQVADLEVALARLCYLCMTQGDDDIVSHPDLSRGLLAIGLDPGLGNPDAITPLMNLGAWANE